MSRQTDKEAKLRAAMESLIQNQNFGIFIEALRELKEGAVAYAISHTSVKDQRESLAALGECRAYADIIDIYESHLQAIEHNLVEASEEQGS